MVGCSVYASIVVFTHFLFVIFVRDFNVLICLVGLLVWALMPIVFGLLQGFNSEPTLTGAVYNEIFSDGVFWLTSIVTVGLMVIPYFVYRFIRDLLMYPEFNFA